MLALMLVLMLVPLTAAGQHSTTKGHVESAGQHSTTKRHAEAAGQHSLPSLAARLDTLIARELPAGSSVGISVYDLTAGVSLYRHDGDKLSRPASTMKLLTAVTALSQADADAPFRTEVWYRGTIARDTLHGDLYVVGGFDPEFDDAALDSLVDRVAALPFSVVAGRVLGDVSMKDSLYWGEGWLWDDTPSAFQPYLSPLMLHKGVVDVTATPTVRDSAATLEVTPVSSYYTIENQTRSRTPAAGGFRVTRNWLQHGNRLLVSGNVDRTTSGSVNIYPSEHFFMHTFLDRLHARGIRTAPPYSSDTLPYSSAELPYSSTELPYSFAELPADSLCVLVARHETPMQTVLDQMMKESDNLNAEAMLCRLGAQTTGRKHIAARDGLDAIRALIRALGDNPKRYRLADGCGLSQYNHLTPDLLVDFLRFAYSRTELFQKLYKALPVSGIDGTLKHRMKFKPLYRNVHAKTGTITGICCLAGYMRAADGHEIAFAIMNQNQLSGTAARNFQDRVCEEIAR
jgi:D-alanyl-D-alanine carboxypeptidase/D-alanyl-D-alanine-endopeptidase (penicillin-binding protein 4)